MIGFERYFSVAIAFKCVLGEMSRLQSNQYAKSLSVPPNHLYWNKSTWNQYTLTLFPPAPLSESNQASASDSQKLMYLRIYLQINMGKCKFNRIWLENIEFSALLKPGEGNVFEARSAPFAKWISVCLANVALASAEAPATTTGDLRATFGSTSTLKAEVL